ncbi:MAG: Uma2 family endonuclease [Gemmatimonadales bacterium]
MPDLARRYTVDDVLAFPTDGNRYELVDGELLVTPAPSQRHQGVLARLLGALIPYVSSHQPVATLFPGPGDVFWDDEDYVQPDLLVIPSDQVTGRWEDVRTLLLAVEVVSPGSARHDRVTKRRLYQQMRVATYWVVDPDARLVEVWHPPDTRPEIVTGDLVWRVAAEAAEVRISLEEIFRT